MKFNAFNVWLFIVFSHLIEHSHNDSEVFVLLQKRLLADHVSIEFQVYG